MKESVLWHGALKGGGSQNLCCYIVVKVFGPHIDL